MNENSFAGLLRLIMNKEDITTIINYASDLLAAALVIVDASPQMNFYALSTNRMPRDPYWAEAFKRGKCTERLLEGVYGSDFVITMSGKIQGGYSVNPDNQTLKYWCYLPLYNSNQYGMSIIALPDIDVFSEKQVDLLHLFIKVLTLNYTDALQPSNIPFHPNQQDFHSAIRGIPASIPTHETTSMEFYERNISPTNYEPLTWDHVQIIAAELNLTDRTLSMWQVMINAVNDIVENHSATVLDGRIIALTGLLPNDKLDALQAVASEYDFHVGISWAFSSRTEAPAHYSQALYAIKTALRIPNVVSNPANERNRIHLYDQFYHYHLIDDNLIVTHWDDFRPKTLRILEDYDRAHNTKLYLTFKEYLLQNQRVATTAKKLKLHKSTVQHRIETIQNLLGDIDLSSEAIASLLAAYAIDSII